MRIKTASTSWFRSVAGKGRADSTDFVLRELTDKGADVGNISCSPCLLFVQTIFVFPQQNITLQCTLVFLAGDSGSLLVRTAAHTAIFVSSAGLGS